MKRLLLNISLIGVKHDVKYHFIVSHQECKYSTTYESNNLNIRLINIDFCLRKQIDLARIWCVRCMCTILLHCRKVEKSKVVVALNLKLAIEFVFRFFSYWIYRWKYLIMWSIVINNNEVKKKRDRSHYCYYYLSNK